MGNVNKRFKSRSAVEQQEHVVTTFDKAHKVRKYARYPSAVLVTTGLLEQSAKEIKHVSKDASID
jgi:hypothetical protein